MQGLRRKLLLLVVVVLVAIQFVPVDRENPPEHSDPAVPGPVLAVLQQSCFDCHSNRTAWPWYSRVAPVAWFLARHVEEAREHLNFSRWNSLPAGEQAEMKEEIWEHVSEGAMPLDSYLLLHRDARLDEQDLAVLQDWTGGSATGTEGAEGGQEHEHDHDHD